MSGQTTPEKLRKALAAMMFELDESVKPGYFSQEELNATKANRAVTTAFGTEKSSEFSHTIGFWWAVSGLEYYMKYIDEMAKRTPQDLRDYANKYIIGKPHVVGVLMNHEDRARIKLTDRRAREDRRRAGGRRHEAPPRWRSRFAAGAARAQSDTATVSYTVSGVRVIQRKTTASIVVANLYLLGGVRQMTARTAGIENFLLAVSEFGTQKYPKETMRRALARTGSEIPGGAGRGLDAGERPHDDERSLIPPGRSSPSGSCTRRWTRATSSSCATRW